MITCGFHVGVGRYPTRVSLHMPENNNSITLRSGDGEITLFGLPTEITDLLIKHYGTPPENKSIPEIAQGIAP